MKGLNVKKLAAIGVGAALIGTALAPMVSAITLDKSNVVAAGVPVVDVVVGANAAVSDVVAAGNIAAAIAQLTYKETDVTDIEVDAEAIAGIGAAEITAKTVDLTVGETKTVTGGRTYKNNMESDTAGAETNFSTISVTHDTLSHLIYEGSKDFTCQGVSSSATMQEKLQFTIDPEYRDSTSSPGLGAKITGGDLDYIIDLGSGIYDNEECTSSGTANFSDDANDSVRIPLFGAWYYVNAYDRSNNKLTLVKTSGTTSYLEGDVIEDLEGKDGEIYSLKMGGGAKTDSTVKFYVTALDASGTEVTNLTGFQSGEDISDGLYHKDTGEKLLETKVTLDEILTKTTDAGGTYYEGSILIGTESVEIKDGSGYPYDSTKTADEYDWGATITTSGGKLTQITISNKQSYKWSGTNLLATGEEASFLEDYGSLKFLGFQLPEFAVNDVTSTESVSSFTLGNDQLVYKDYSYEAEHTLPFYILVADTASDGDYGTFDIDNKTFYWKVELTDNHDVNLVHGQGTFDFNGYLLIDNNANTRITSTDGLGNLKTDTNADGYIEVGDFKFAVGGATTSDYGTHTDGNTGCWITVKSDANITFRKESSTGDLIGEYYFDSGRVMDTNSIGFVGQSEVTHYYVPMVYEAATDEAHIWLFLDDQNFNTKYNKYLALKGTDTDESGGLGDEGDWSHYFYEPDVSETTLPTDYNGGSNYNVKNYKIAQWVFYEDGTRTGAWDMNFFIDTEYEVGDLFVESAPQTYLSYYSTEVDYNAGGNGNADWHMSEGSSSYLSAEDAYTDYGTKVHLKDHVVTVTYPENRAQVEILLSGPETITAVEGESPDEPLAKGETFTTTAGTTVEIKDIKVTTTEAAGGVTEEDVLGWLTVPTAKTMVKLTAPLVVTDEVAFGRAGPHIIVGDHEVNKLAIGITEDLYSAAGEYAAELLDTGDIIVAGYTAADTKAAAQVLIGELEAMLD